MLLSFQRATRRKTPALVVLVIVSGLLSFLTPASGEVGLTAFAIAVLVLSSGLTIFAWLPLGRDTLEPRDDEATPEA